MIATLSGMTLLLSSILMPADWLESVVLRQGPGTLAWGPALFRLLLGIHGILLVAAGQMHPSKTPGPPVVPTLGRGEWLALGGMSAAALALRLWSLDSCLWLDEVLTMVGFARLPVQDILSRFPDQNQHMLYSLAARACLAVFGEHAWSLRLPSVVFGIASIWALFLLGRRVAGTRESLFACAVMTVSYHHVWFSQNARGYMGLLLFSILATWLWLEAREHGGRARWIAYSFSLAFGMWLHLTMAFVAASHFVLWCFTAFRQWRRGQPVDFAPLLAFTLGATLTLQLLAFSLPEFLRSALHEASNDSEWTRPAWVAAEMLRSLKIGFSGVAALVFAGALVLFGWFSLCRRHVESALAMTLPALLGGGLMLAVSHNVWPRFFFFSMGFALLIVIRGAVLAPRLLLRESSFAAPAGAVLAGLLVAASAATLPRCYALPKQDFSGARDFVERNRKPGSRVVSAGLASLVYRGYYAPEWLTAGSAAELEALRSQDPGLSLVYTLPPQLKAFDPALWRVIETEFETVKVFPGTLGGGEVFVGRPRSPVSARSR